MATRRVISDFPPKKHDHRNCVKDALKTAEAVCARQGIRLTELRQQILELVWTRHGPIRAYDILRLLNDSGANATPNTVYRGLDFLLAAGLVHRLESLNAFMGCAKPEARHTGQFLICRKCESAAEIHDPNINRSLIRDAEELGFTTDAQTVELQGLCPSCSA
jgi:Fur family transcriptional regulator, zinc uptake regulator